MLMNPSTSSIYAREAFLYMSLPANDLPKAQATFIDATSRKKQTSQDTAVEITDRT
jgi:hypothetical protein